MSSRSEDHLLPYAFRRCLDPEHKGARVMLLKKFHKAKPRSHNKGHRYECKACFNRKRREAYQPREREYKGAVLEGTEHGFFKIIKDPLQLFNGLFRKWDFAESFDGRDVWAEGTIVEDELGQKFRVQYNPEPGLLNLADNALFVLKKHHMTFERKSNA